MTYYTDTIKPQIDRDPEVMRLEAEIKRAEERLHQLRNDRYNRVTLLACRAFYPSAED